MRIKDVIKEKGLTINELAEILQINRVSLSSAINGNPTVETLTKIANALEVEVWELFTPTIAKGEFMALVKNGPEYYHALTLSELENIVSMLKSKQAEE